MRKQGHVTMDVREQKGDCKRKEPLSRRCGGGKEDEEVFGGSVAYGKRR